MVSREVAACDIKKVVIKQSRGSTVPATKSPRSLDELAKLGKEIFDRQVQPMARPHAASPAGHRLRLVVSGSPRPADVGVG